jgi:hypothetical protein
MGVVIASEPCAVGSAARKNPRSATNFDATLPMSVFMAEAYGQCILIAK